MVPQINEEPTSNGLDRAFVAATKHVWRTEGDAMGALRLFFQCRLSSGNGNDSAKR